MLRLVVLNDHLRKFDLVMLWIVKSNRVEEKLLSMPTLNPEARRLQRLIIGSSTEVEMDANGRIAILPILRAEVGIDKKIMLVGLGKKFEIWPEDVWKENYQGWVGAGPVDTEKLPESIQELVF